jgi:predicted metal-binding protein
LCTGEAERHAIQQLQQHVTMELNIDSTERLQDAPHSCPALSAQLGLQGLACLAACSKSIKIACYNKVFLMLQA